MPTLSGSLDITGSINVTGSIANNGAPVVTSTQTGSFVTNSQTGSFVTNSQTGSFVTNSQTGSFATTGSNTFNGNVTVTGSMVITGSLTISGSGTLTNIGPARFRGNTANSATATALEITGGLQVSASIDSVNRYLYNGTSNTPVLQWGPFNLDLKLVDVNTNTSVLWGARNLFDENGLTSIDWNAANSYAPRTLLDASELASVKWGLRQLLYSSGSTAFNWGTPGKIFMSGSVIVTGSITGSLLGTGSYALQSLSASYAPSSPAFPYTGNAFITGSLAISGGLLLPTIPDNNAVVSPTYGYMNMFSRGGIHIYDPSVYNNKIIISNILGMQTQLGCETFLMSNSDGNALSSWIASTTSGLTENTLYSAGTANLKIQSETQLILSGSSSKLILSSSAVTVTGSLRLTGSLSLANGSITMRTGSTSLTAGAGAINLQSGVIDRIPSLILASSNNSNTVKIGSYANDSHYITSSNNLTVIAPSLILQSGLHEVYGDMLLYNGITITGTTNVNGLMTLEPTHPLPSVINGSVAYSSSGDFYFASGSAWKKLTL